VLRKMDLCDRCAARLSEAYDVHMVCGRLCTRVECANCGHKEYGATYEVRTRKEEM